jgi:hypothetical protein
MATIISDSRNVTYDGNINTANGFYRAIYSNLGCSFTPASLTSTVNIPVTFTGTGNIMGVALWLSSVNTGTDRPIKVELQEFVGGTTWTARTSKTLTYAEITANLDPLRAYYYQFTTQGFITGFKFATPYAVNTTAGIWRFQITSTAGTGYWNTRMVASGVYSLVAWDDTKITFTSNQDQFVAIDKIVLNSAVTLLGALQTGDTVNQVCGWIGSGMSSWDEDACMLTWADTPASSYKVTVTGRIYYGSNGGFRAGTDAVPIPISAMGHMEFTQASLGTNNASIGSGFFNHDAGASTSGGGHMFLYGEIPAYEDDLLAADAAAGQKVFVTQNVTGWVAGDKVALGGADTPGDTDAVLYEIASVAGDGKTITLTVNIGNKRWAGHSVIRMNGYGFKMSSTYAQGINHRCYSYESWIMRGVEFYFINWCTLVSAPFATIRAWSISHCSANLDFVYGGAAFAGCFLYGGGGSASTNPTFAGTYMDHVNCFGGHPTYNLYVANGAGLFSLTNCIDINANHRAFMPYSMAGKYIYSNNRHYHTWLAHVRLTGWNCTIENNVLWGSSGGGTSGYGGFTIFNLFNSTLGGNKFDNNAVGVNFTNTGPSLNNVSRNDEFGQQKANSYDIYMVVGGLHEAEFENFKGNASVYWWSWLWHGTKLKLTKANQVEGSDHIYLEEGDMYKCGTGLSDTTKHNETYSLKLVPKANILNSGIPLQIPLKWTQKIPTENIQNKDMMVGIWIKIANSAYWTTGGTYQMPRITVNYDNGTYAYGEAAQTTDWQFVFVPFTPLTTYGEIEISISGQTQAATANAAFYAAEMSVLYPAGHNIAMGKFNTWSSSLPTMPSISTTISASDVWAVDPASFGASTVGDKVNKIKQDTGIIPALL